MQSILRIGVQRTLDPEISLTDIEARYMDWIMHRIRCYSCPTCMDVAAHFGVSRVHAARTIGSLVEKGYLKVVPTNRMRHTWVPLVSKYWHIKDRSIVDARR